MPCSSTHHPRLVQPPERGLLESALPTGAQVLSEPGDVQRVDDEVVGRKSRVVALLQKVQKVDHRLFRLRDPESAVDAEAKEQVWSNVSVDKTMTVEQPDRLGPAWKHPRRNVGMRTDARLTEPMAIQCGFRREVGGRHPAVAENLRRFFNLWMKLDDHFGNMSASPLSRLSVTSVVCSCPCWLMVGGNLRWISVPTISKERFSVLPFPGPSVES